MGLYFTSATTHKQLPLNHVLTAWVQGEWHLLQFSWRTWQKARAVKRGMREMTIRNSRSSGSSEGGNSSWRKPQSSAGWVSNTDPGPCQGSHVNPRGCAGSWPKAPGLGHCTEDFWISEPSAQGTHYMSLTQWIPANQQTVISEHLELPNTNDLTGHSLQ